ncbi:hypothetical protein HYH02_005869 [Chlamydomonas schloesseri]|uniref:Rotatin N-terminal domain-containing protein n=1 Tax=Chlamydomonas schloesseri TaxID=2026947 RepID=A0A836B6J1_9CHLO|nr:hypothetical protein HYH02_005869 [Chlamydomonas schloesseri]|eukprot:KAG2449121.1 hypothetical protein HYH02_005869 [Chlamydomonas schloesseri]
MAQDSLASLVATTDKLGHQLAEVRRRAVQSLDFKLKHRLLSPEDLAKERAVLKNLLGCLQFADNGIPTDAAVLILLGKVAAAPFAARQLLHLGAEGVLAQLQQTRPPDLQPIIQATLNTLLAAPPAARTGVSTPAATQRPFFADVPLSHPSTATASRCMQSSAGATPALMSALPDARGPPAFTFSPARHTVHGAVASPHRHAGEPAAAAAAAEARDQQVVTSTPSVARALLARRAAARLTYLDQDGAAAGGAGGAGGTTGDSARDWLLQPVSLGQADDQQLFELSLRLKYVEDPRVVLPALTQLHGAALADLPVEAVAARHEIVNHLLVLLVSASSTPDLVALAAQCLLRIVTLLKRALLLATDPAYAATAGAASSKGRGDSEAGAADGPSSPGGGPSVEGAAAQQDCGSATQPEQLLPHGLPPAPVDGGGGFTGAGSRSLGAAWAAGDEPLNVTRLAYLIALQVFGALKDPQRLFAAAPLAEELLPLLLLDREGPRVVVSEAECIKWSQLLQALSAALVANLSIARAESPPIVQAFTRDLAASAGPPLPVINAPTVAVLSLAARLVSALPQELWVPNIVPPVLVDTLAAVARDEVLSMLLPGLRAATQPLLAMLRPDTVLLLDVAAASEAALAAGEDLTRQLPALRSGRLDPEPWLARLEAALPALHLPGQAALLQAVLQGLAVVCSSRGSAGAADSGRYGTSRKLAWASATASASSPGRAAAPGAAVVSEATDPAWVSRAEGLCLQLLSYSSPEVALACYAQLEGMVMEARAELGHPLPRLLTRKAVLELLVVQGLADERSRRQVARILLQLMPDAELQSRILPWAFWIRLYESDPQVGTLAAALAAAEREQQAPSAAVEASRWPQLRAHTLAMFSKDPEHRRAAAQQLASELHDAGGNPILQATQGEPYTADPFRVCLDGGARDDLVIPAANPRLARSFRPADVSNLLAILANQELALELRRSAAEQMLALAGEERLRESLEEQASLHAIACVAALRDPASGAALRGSQAGGLAAQGVPPPTPDLLSTLDVQLPIAAMNLLYVLAAHSPRVRAWLITPAAQASRPRTGPHGASACAATGAGTGGGDGGGGGGLEMLVSGMMPLIFHSMVTVRRAVARLLAALCMGGEADRWTGWDAAARSARASGTSSPGNGAGTGCAGDVLVLPYPFERGCVLPCRTTWAALPLVGGPASSTRPGQGIALDGKPLLQNLVAEQRELVVLLVQERQALRTAGGNPAGLLVLMNEHPDLIGYLPPAALHTLAASIRAVAPAGLVARGLAAVGAATCHAECTSALHALQLVCGTRQGIAALAAADWQARLENLLSTCPTSPEDRALWIELLAPVRRMVLSGALAQAQLLQLAEYFSRSAHPLLSAPDAATDPPPLPVALANTPLLPDHLNQHTSLACTQALLATLVDLLRCARSHLPQHQARRLLAALSPTPLFRTLGSAYVGNADANYGCRVLALQLLLEALRLLSGAAEPAVMPVEPDLREALMECLYGVLANVSGGFAAAAAAAPVLARQPQASAKAARGADASSSTAATSSCGGGAHGFAGKGAVRLAMSCLLHLTELLPAGEWTTCWQQMSGSFWVSRLLRDRDTVLRALAVEVLGRLLQPGADATQAMVAQGWPDAVKAMVKIVMDRSSRYTLRTAAVRVLVCCMAQDAAADRAQADGDILNSPLPRRQLFASVSALRPAALLLQHRDLWAQLPAMVREPDAPAGFVAAVLSLLLQGLLLDSDRTVAVMRQPGLIGRVLELLDPKAVETGSGVPAKTSTGVTPAWPARTAAIATYGLAHGAWEAAPPPATATAPGRATAPEVPVDTQVECVTGLEVAVATLQQTAAATAAAAAGADPALPLHRVQGLLVSALAAQLLAHTQQCEPALLPLGALLGRGAEAKAAHATLCAFARLAAGMASLDAARGVQTIAASTEAAAKMDAVCQAAAASNALLQLLDEDEALQLLVSVDAGLLRSPGPLLCQCAEVLTVSCSPRPLRLAVVCLLATLLARKETARALLLFPSTDDEHLVGRNGVEVGADLCGALAALLPDDALAPAPAPGHPPITSAGAQTPGVAAPSPLQPSAARSNPLAASTSSLLPAFAAQHGPHAARHAGYPDSGSATAGSPQGLSSSDLCIIISLRNLLAFSSAAKTAALRNGYHRFLFDCCSRAAAVLAAATAGARPVGGERKPPSGTPKQAAAGAAGRGVRGSVASSARVSAGGPQRYRGLRPGFVGAQPQRQQADPDPAEEAELTGSEIEGLIDEPQVLLASPQVGRPSELAAAAARGGGPERASAAPAAASGAAAPQARSMLEQKVVAALSLIKHLALDSVPARAALVRDGVLAVLRALWPHASSATSGPLFHELLGCLNNLLPECAEARARVATEGGSVAAGAAAEGAPGTLLGSLVACIFGAARLETTTFTLAVGVLLQMAGAEDGVHHLLRSPFLAACHKSLQDSANAHAPGGGAAAKLGRDLARQAALLQVLTSVAAWPAGQHALLRSTAAPGLMELVVRVVSLDPAALAAPAAAAAGASAQHAPQQHLVLQLHNSGLALLRNLCFAAEAKAHLLANPAVLPALVAAAEGVAINPEGAAYAASGLWSLVYLGEKVKAALRRVPSAQQRLIAASATCRFQESRAKSQIEALITQQQAALGGDVGSVGADAAALVGAQGPEVQALQQRVNWLRQAEMQLAGLMEALQSAETVGAAGAGAGGRAWRAPMDRSPLRDQTGALRVTPATMFGYPGMPMYPGAMPMYAGMPGAPAGQHSQAKPTARGGSIMKGRHRGQGKDKDKKEKEEPEGPDAEDMLDMAEDIADAAQNMADMAQQQPQDFGGQGFPGYDPSGMMGPGAMGFPGMGMGMGFPGMGM